MRMFVLQPLMPVPVCMRLARSGKRGRATGRVPAETSRRDRHARQCALEHDCLDRNEASAREAGDTLRSNATRDVAENSRGGGADSHPRSLKLRAAPLLWSDTLRACCTRSRALPLINRRLRRLRRLRRRRKRRQRRRRNKANWRERQDRSFRETASQQVLTRRRGQPRSEQGRQHDGSWGKANRSLRHRPAA